MKIRFDVYVDDDLFKRPIDYVLLYKCLVSAFSIRIKSYIKSLKEVE